MSDTTHFFLAMLVGSTLANLFFIATRTHNFGGVACWIFFLALFLGSWANDYRWFQ